MDTNSPKWHSALDAKLKALETGLDPQRADAFLEELLGLLGTCGHLLCTVVDKRHLQVRSPDGILCEATLRLATSKLRSLCARLAVRCREWSGRDVALHGDDIELEYPKTRQRCRIRFENKPGSQRIELEGASTRNVDCHAEHESVMVNDAVERSAGKKGAN
jgi:hypothetical protein